jgi:hypothetical protein
VRQGSGGSGEGGDLPADQLYSDPARRSQQTIASNEGRLKSAIYTTNPHLRLLAALADTNDGGWLTLIFAIFARYRQGRDNTIYLGPRAINLLYICS